MCYRLSTIRAATYALSIGVTACAVGPNFKRPPPPAASDYGSAPTQGQTAEADSAGGNAQHLVADVMAIGVIDVLEVIDID